MKNIIIAIGKIISFILTVIGAIVLCRQCSFSKEQIELEQQENQPIFNISLSQQLDREDGIYGTDILEIRNVGFRHRSLCAVSVRMFFKLTHVVDQKTSVYLAEVGDYFALSSYGNGEESLLYRTFTIGNNRKYLEVYRAAMTDRISSEEYYFIDRVVLVRLSYKDIYGKEHTLYFNKDVEIDEKEYDSYINNQGDTIYIGCYKLNYISYDKMKSYTK